VALSGKDTTTERMQKPIIGFHISQPEHDSTSSIPLYKTSKLWYNTNTSALGGEDRRNGEKPDTPFLFFFATFIILNKSTKSQNKN